MRKLFLAAAAVCSMLAAPALAAVHVVHFKVDPNRYPGLSEWELISGSQAPYGLPSQPTLTGSFTYDDGDAIPDTGSATGNASGFTSLSFVTGTRTWTLADLDPVESSVSFFNGEVANFTLWIDLLNRVSAGGSAVLGEGTNWIICNSCTDFDNPVAGVPEPATWALMITGFGLAGSGLRRRPRTAVPRPYGS